MTAIDHSRRIHVVADLGRAARRDPMPFVLTYTLTGEEIASARTAELAEALAAALHAQARATEPTHTATLSAGVKWSQARLAAGLRWTAYCFVCDRTLYSAEDGTPVMVADSRQRQGVCLECKATTNVYVTAETPVGTTR